ncbi:MAG TPA: hypothetical protein VKN99_05985 [Polyangia bacterium]|nr:hypothetical protein [Polyangia bacterium]
MSQLGLVLDQVIARYAAGEHQAEAARARAEFLEATGQVFDDDPWFEERITAFLEWYALERPLDGRGSRPIDQYLCDATLASEARAAARALASSHWSLFRVLELAPGRAHLEDLLAGGRFVVHERRKLTGIEAGDVFEARLLSDSGKTLFGRTFCFHPRDAVEAILEVIAEASERRNSKQDLLFRLAERRLRCERYRNVHAAKLYAAR